tara:strand:+ start:141 stop:242 length:102 start_codon:yes stop_codon:yes gene_type:complete
MFLDTMRLTGLEEGTIHGGGKLIETPANPDREI